MKNILTSFYAKPIALYLAFALFTLAALSGPAEAMLLPATPDASHQSPERAADLAKVRSALESRVLQQRLLDYGLTSEEAAARISGLSDEQLHQLAANIDALQPGGDAVGTLFALALIAGLVVLIIFILQGKIAIEKK